ncbi:MAG: hypothetical protein HZA60_08705 [Deltaproteobacteria bacterium]|nr:hypothetical protein [Deltaproteobacteria bacterium]
MGTLGAIFLLSAAAIADEIFLIRLLSLRFWPYFVPLIISQAMLGFGAAGVATHLLRWRIARSPERVFAWLVLLAAPAFDLAFRASQAVRFDPFLLMWDTSAWPAFCGFFLLLSAPFALAGGAVVVPLSFGMGKAGPVYAANLAGSAAGALLALPAFSLVPTDSLLRIPVALGLVSGAFVLRAPEGRLSRGRIGPCVACLLLLFLPPPAPSMSPFKDMAVALRLPDAKVIAARSGPTGDYRAVFAPAMHFAPGLSMRYTGEIPPQAAVFADGELRGAAPKAGGPLPPGYLAYLPAALPYRLVQRPSVLQFGLRGTEGVLASAVNGASKVTAVESAEEYVRLIRDDLAPFSGGWPPGVAVEIRTEGHRTYLSRDKRRFDIIELADISSGTFSSLGVHAAGESFLLTREGIRAMLSHLSDRGMISSSGWLKAPPRESVKILRTFREAFTEAGLSPASERILLVRGWGSFALVARPSPFTPAEVGRARRWCETMGFGTVWPPPLSVEEGGAEERAFREAVRAAVTGATEGSGTELFDLRPATDDSPYFYRFLRLGSLPEFRRLLGNQWVPFVEWGVLFLLLSLAVSLALAALFLLLPPALSGKYSTQGAIPLAGYFSALGTAYMLVELTFLKAGILVLGDTIRAATAAIGGFTLFSGLGSALSEKSGSARTMRWIFPGIALLSAAGFLCLTGASSYLLASAGGWRASIFVASFAPAAFLMGMPFPAAVSGMSRGNARSIPLAWGINGFFSVSGASLASVAALWGGFRLSILGGALLYLLAGALYPRLFPR